MSKWGECAIAICKAGAAKGTGLTAGRVGEGLRRSIYESSGEEGRSSGGG